MSTFFLDYNDPLFSIIVLFIIIGAICVATYFWNAYSENVKTASLNKSLIKIDGEIDNQNVEWVLQTINKPLKPLLFLADVYRKNGEYNEAINIYTALVSNIQKARLKTYILQELGICYYMAGLLQRSRDVFLQVLKNFPRNKIALTYLLDIYSDMKEYSKAMEVLTPLEELLVDIKYKKDFLNAKIIMNSPTLSIGDKCSKLLETMQKHKQFRRFILEFIAQVNSDLFFEQLQNEDISNIIDILWNMPETKISKSLFHDQKNEHREHLHSKDLDIPKHKALKAIFSARNIQGFYSEHSDILEIQSIIALKRYSKRHATLGFKYICASCGYISPVSFERCNECKDILSVIVKYALIDTIDEENSSLL